MRRVDNEVTELCCPSSNRSRTRASRAHTLEPAIRSASIMLLPPPPLPPPPPPLPLRVFHYSQLLAAASSSSQQPLNDPLHRLSSREGFGLGSTVTTSLLTRLMEALGPRGPGLLAIRGVPALHSLRKALLPLARTLALLPATKRSPVLQDHGFGTDVPLKGPDRPVSSFAAQLKFGLHHARLALPRNTSAKLHDSAIEQEGAPQTCQYPYATDLASSKVEDNSAIPSQVSASIHKQESELHQLGPLFRRLGEEMVEVGLLVARLCDMAICGAGLEQAILESCTAKGRLIHYHSLQDKFFLQASSNTGIESKVTTKVLGSADKCLNCQKDASKDLWQQWHFDYGIFTVLTSPMFFSFLLNPADCNIDNALTSSYSEQNLFTNAKECRPPYGHIGLKILNTASDRVEFVSVPPDCLVLQVGEAAQILTGGEVRATAHCVCRPVDRADISRETYVVFLQPSWQKPLVSPKGHVKSGLPNSANDKTKDGKASLTQEFEEIQRKIPPLESRWKEGCTFSEFSRETTKQYYGADGVQSRKQHLKQQPLTRYYK